MTRPNLVIVLVIALVATALVQVPYALGAALARPSWEFTGVIMNPEDSQSYFAKMLQGCDGNWLYTIPFTTEEHAPAFVGGFYLGLGHLARGLGVSLVTMWHLARIAADVVLFLATFGFIAQFLEDARARWMAYLLALGGSGLGWVLFLLNQPYWLGWFPVDFKMPESHLFFSALTFPHVALGSALILASLWCAQRISASEKWRYAIGAGAANLALAIVYPFLIYLVAATVGIYWTYLGACARRLRWRAGLLLAASFLIPAPLILGYALTLFTNSVFRAWDAQAITPSPPPPHYLLAYGVMLILAVLSVRRGRAGFALLWCWIGAVMLLIYAPLNPQRRFVQAVQVPLAVLTAAAWFDSVLPWVAQTRLFRWLATRPSYSVAGLERLLSIAFLLLMSLSNFYILASTAVTAAIEQPYPLFRARAEIAAVDWLRANTAHAEAVLGAYQTGNYIAARAGNRVMLGHWAETVDWQRKMDQVERFYYTATDDTWRVALLRDYRIAYVFWGTGERDLGAFDPEGASYLERVFANETARVYRVRAGER